MMATMDKFQQQALELVLGSEARVAFDIDQRRPEDRPTATGRRRGAGTR